MAKGYPAWNKGLTKATDPRVERNAKNTSLARIRLRTPVWNTGLTKENNESLRKLSVQNSVSCPIDCKCGRHKTSWNKGLPAWNRGIPRPVSVKAKIRAKLVGRVGASTTCDFGCVCKRHLPATTVKRMETFLDRYGRADGPVQDTKPERLTDVWLRAHNISYEKQACKGGVSVDFYIPDSKTCIFVDGCYWHSCPIHFPERNGQASRRYYRDIYFTNKLIGLGYKVIRIWECAVISNQFSVLEENLYVMA